MSSCTSGLLIKIKLSYNKKIANVTKHAFNCGIVPFLPRLIGKGLIFCGSISVYGAAFVELLCSRVALLHVIIYMCNCWSMDYFAAVTR